MTFSVKTQHKFYILSVVVFVLFFLVNVIMAIEKMIHGNDDCCKQVILSVRAFKYNAISICKDRRNYNKLWVWFVIAQPSLIRYVYSLVTVP